jgi:hypothetical protein
MTRCQYGGGDGEPMIVVLPEDMAGFTVLRLPSSPRGYKGINCRAEDGRLRICAKSRPRRAGLRARVWVAEQTGVATYSRWRWVALDDAATCP